MSGGIFFLVSYNKGNLNEEQYIVLNTLNTHIKNNKFVITFFKCKTYMCEEEQFTWVDICKEIQFYQEEQFGGGWQILKCKYKFYIKNVNTKRENIY